MGNKRIIFLGEKPLGLKCLKLLRSIPDAEVVAVCTRTRGEMWWGRQEILDYCTDEQVPIIPRETILNYEIDLLISVLYPFVIEPELIKHATAGCFNLHEAPLPRWRGCNSYSHALLAGDTLYGTTLHEMTPMLDSGRIVAQCRFPVLEWETAKELYERTSLESYALAETWFPKLVQGDYAFQEPVVGEASYLNQRNSLAGVKNIARGISPHDALKFVLALDFIPWEPSFIEHDGVKYYLFIDGSSGRDPLRKAKILSNVQSLELVDWGTFETGIINGLPRPLAICKADVYRRLFPLQGVAE